MGLPRELVGNPWPDVRWGGVDKPIVLLDGALHRLSEITGHLAGRAAYVVGIRQKHFEALCARLDVQAIQFYEMRVDDLGALARIDSLRHLAIRWNTKLVDIAPLRPLTLTTLILEDTPHVRDLAPLSALAGLRHVEFCGGVWNRNTAASLAPLATLPRLEDLALTNLKVESHGLRPLARCRALQHLRVSNQFPTEEYAYLSAKLPHTECHLFAPYLKLQHPIDDKDVMVVGRRKPLLNSRKDAERLARYELAFWNLQRDFLAQELS
jgi:hypothetical protein